MSEDDIASKLAVHEAVCADQHKQATDRPGKIEMVLAAIILLLVGESSFEASSLAQAELRVKQLVDRLEGRDLAPLKLAQEVL